MSNNNLTNAKKAKNDEFYTQYVDIEKELQYYDFSGKSIYCNCDNPHHSNFYKYFKDNFQKLNITHLYCTGYNKDGNGYYAEYNGTEETIKTLNGNGSFDSDECKQIMQECDIVITNPPFSLFRDYVKQLMDYNKKFLIIGSQNAITYKEIFHYIKNNELWLGVHSNKTMEFSMPMSYEGDTVVGNRKIGKVPSISWFTNIPYINTKQPLILTKTYNPIDYPHYDNYDAINVDKVKDIPMDYDGVMGVPITFLCKYCPAQFEILDGANRYLILDYFNVNERIKLEHSHCCNINGNAKYFRILIKKNDSLEPILFEIIGLAADKRYDDKCFIKGSPIYLDDKHKQFMGMVLNGKATYARILIKRI